MQTKQEHLSLQHLRDTRAESARARSRRQLARFPVVLADVAATSVRSSGQIRSRPGRPGLSRSGVARAGVARICSDPQRDRALHHAQPAERLREAAADALGTERRTLTGRFASKLLRQGQQDRVGAWSRPQ